MENKIVPSETKFYLISRGRAPIQTGLEAKDTGSVDQNWEVVILIVTKGDGQP